MIIQSTFHPRLFRRCKLVNHLFWTIWLSGICTMGPMAIFHSDRVYTSSDAEVYIFPISWLVCAVAGYFIIFRLHRRYTSRVMQEQGHIFNDDGIYFFNRNKERVIKMIDYYDITTIAYCAWRCQRKAGYGQIIFSSAKQKDALIIEDLANVKTIYEKVAEELSKYPNIKKIGHWGCFNFYPMPDPG